VFHALRSDSTPVAMVVLSYERKKFFFHEMAQRRGLMGHWKYTKEEKLILSFIQKGLYGFQAAVCCLSSRSRFARMKEGMTKLQAVYNTCTYVDSNLPKFPLIITISNNFKPTPPSRQSHLHTPPYKL